MKKRPGFIFTELIMVIVVTAVITTMFSLVIYGGMNSWLFMRGQKNLMMDVSSAMRRMAREIKSTRGTSDIDILTFTATRYQFIDMNNNVIDYQIAGATLTRNDQILLENLPADGLAFVYLDKNGVVTAEKSDLRIIIITLKTVSGYNRLSLQSAAGLRIR
jgi:hypothetical protein